MTDQRRGAGEAGLRVVRLMLLVLFGGVFIGAGFALLSGLFFLIIIVPAIMGAVNGWVLAAALQRWKITGRRLVFGCAIVMALTSFATFQTMQYLIWQRGFAPGEQPAPAPGDPSLGAYVQARAADGLPLRVLRGRAGFVRLRGPLVWLYWGLEAILIGAVTLWPVRQALRRPFCQECRQWKTSSHLGTLRIEDQPAIVQAMHQQRYDNLLGYRQAGSLDPPTLELYLEHCACAERDMALRLGRAELGVGAQIVIKDVELVPVPYARAGPLLQLRDRLA